MKRYFLKNYLRITMSEFSNTVTLKNDITLKDDEIKTVEEFEDLNQLEDFENIKSGNYKKWIELYPKSINIFFKLLLEYGESSKEGLTDSDVKFFIKNGFDINQEDYYRTDLIKTKISPLHHACEFRNDRLMKILLDNGADINQVIKTSKSNITIIDSLLEGHSEEDSEDFESIEKCIKILNQYGCNYVPFK